LLESRRIGSVEISVVVLFWGDRIVSARIVVQWLGVFFIEALVMAVAVVDVLD